MNEPENSEISDSLVDQSVDFSLEIAALQLLGAHQFDPVHFHYLQALAQRVRVHQGRVNCLLGRKLTQALVVFRARFKQAQCEAKNSIARVTLQYPHAAADLQQLLNAGDLTGVRRFVATLERCDPRESLGDLARYMAQHSAEPVDGLLNAHVGSRSELKSVRNFRNTWSKLSTDKQVTQALGQAPKNAGPINSHRLVLRSLALMRDISPDYLNRFVSYVDTLLCLDQCDKEKQTTTKKVAQADRSKKMKPPRPVGRLAK